MTNYQTNNSYMWSHRKTPYDCTTRRFSWSGSKFKWRQLEVT